MVEHEIGKVTHFTQFLHRSSLNNTTSAPAQCFPQIQLRVTQLELTLIVLTITHVNTSNANKGTAENSVTRWVREKKRKKTT